MQRFVTKADLATHVGISRQAVQDAVNKGRIPIGSDKMIDTHHADVIDYVSRSVERLQQKKIDDKLKKEKNKIKKRESETDHQRKIKIKSSASYASGSNDRRTLELKKLNAQVVQLELKNMQVRGELANGKFYEDVFYSQLSYAINQFLSLPDSIVDDLISMVLDMGMSARSLIVQKMTKRINLINVGASNGWKRNIERIRDEVIEQEDEQE